MDILRLFESGKLGPIDVTNISHLGIVAQFCRRIGLIQTVNQAVPGSRKVDAGTVVQAMVLDTLSGRSPLYMLKDFVKEQDSEILLGRKIDHELFNDSAVGRVMDALYDAGTQKVFSQIAFEGITALCPGEDIKYLHYDTTSKNVHGEYNVPEDKGGPAITYGRSKDKRPDLKQFMVELMCVHQNIPILGHTVDGNSSDKKLNHKMLTRMSNHLARYGIGDGAFVYIADSAMVTEYNLEALGENNFITRLPFNYKEAGLAVSRAVSAEDTWRKVPLKEVIKGSRPLAEYKVQEIAVTLYGKKYRGVVVHSSAHDKRRQKRLERRLADSVTAVTSDLKTACKTEYFCREDAEAAAKRLSDNHSMYHSLDVCVEQKITYGKGKPPKDPEKRRITSIKYLLKGRIIENVDRIELAREESGCFVLLTNTPVVGEMAHSGEEVLAAYKEQHGIERDFSFIKNPAIMNSVFLKNPERIEVLGLIMLIALLVWNLMQHVMRRNIKETGSIVEGLAGRKTTAPTSYVMTTKFRVVDIQEFYGTRKFNRPLSPVQEKYLEMLEIEPVYLLYYDGKTRELDKAAILAKLDM